MLSSNNYRVGKSVHHFPTEKIKQSSIYFRNIYCTPRSRNCRQNNIESNIWILKAHTESYSTDYVYLIKAHNFNSNLINNSEKLSWNLTKLQSRHRPLFKFHIQANNSSRNIVETLLYRAPNKFIIAKGNSWWKRGLVRAVASVGPGGPPPPLIKSWPPWLAWGGIWRILNSKLIFYKY